MATTTAMRAYLAKTKPIPPTARVPWHLRALPCFAALFLWAGYFQELAAGSIDRAPLGTVFLGLVTGALAGYLLLFLIPAAMGMQTGYPTPVLGSSTFGSRGGLLIPGPLLALVLSAWLGAAAWLAAQGVRLIAGGESSGAWLPPITVVLWAGAFAWAGHSSLRAVAIASSCLVAFPLLALFIGLVAAGPGIPQWEMEVPEPLFGYAYTTHLVAAFLAPFAAASPAVSRLLASKRDLRRAGLLGISAPASVAGLAALLIVAGARALNPGIEDLRFLSAAAGLSGLSATAVLALVAAGAIPASWFIAWLALDSAKVMFPGLPRPALSLGVAAVAVLTAFSGLPGDLSLFITLSGALCAPLCGIMAADYWQHERRWPHTRPGVNYAGFGAWILGVFAGAVHLMPIPEHFQRLAHPAALLAWAAGFAGYIVLGNLGLKPYRKHRRRRARTDAWEEPAPPLGLR